jgi:hypothetical protein
VAVISRLLVLGLLTWACSPALKAGPGERLAHALAYDPQRERIVLFGGLDSSGTPLGDTWEWDGRRWKQVADSGPPPRRWSAMAYDEARGAMVLFGGRDGIGRAGASLADTWEWNGSEWRPIDAAGPAGRDHHTLTWDPVRNALLLFGGWDGQRVVADGWILRGSRWSRLPGPEPPARAAHASAFDQILNQVVIFGGRALDHFFADTWLWNGERWQEGEGKGPPARAFHGFAYDSTMAGSVLFGGRVGDERFDDTWIYRAGQWQLLPVQPSPAKRYVYSMTYDAARCSVMFHGGGRQNPETQRWELYGETWMFKGGRWSEPGTAGNSNQC